MRFSGSFDAHVIMVVRLGKLGAVENRRPSVLKLLEQGKAAATNPFTEGSTGANQHLGCGHLCYTHWHVGKAEEKLEINVTEKFVSRTLACLNSALYFCRISFSTSP